MPRGLILPQGKSDDKPGTLVVLVVGGPIATGHLAWRRSHSVSGKCQGRDLHRLRRWDTQGLEEQVYLVTLAVEEASQNYNDDE